MKNVNLSWKLKIIYDWWGRHSFFLSELSYKCFNRCKLLSQQNCRGFNNKWCVWWCCSILISQSSVVWGSFFSNPQKPKKKLNINRWSPFVWDLAVLAAYFSFISKLWLECHLWPAIHFSAAHCIHRKCNLTRPRTWKHLGVQPGHPVSRVIWCFESYVRHPLPDHYY